MLFLRLFFGVLVTGAIATLGYAVYLTFEPLNAPPKEEPEPALLAAKVAVKEPVAVDSEVPAGVQAPVAPAKPALDRLRKSVKVARSAVGEAKRVGTDIADAAPDAEDLTIENAWRQARRATAAVVGEVEPVLDTGALPTGSRIHGSGAPAQGGRGYARPPGVDWYREGGKGVE